jgi:hypothetical protein
MPESDYAFPFFGRRAWTTPIPAILAYKTKCPIMVATLLRKKGKYFIHYSDPIWPKLDRPMEEEVNRMMKESLLLLEEKIRENPGQWLWQHNRWKQETPINVYYSFRWDSILIILPKERNSFMRILPHLATFRTIYPLAFITIMVFKPFQKEIVLKDAEILPYQEDENLFIRDYRFKLVFNFSKVKMLKPHFLKLSAFEVLSEKNLQKLAKEHLTPEDDLSLILKKALCRPNTIWKKEESYAF